MLFPNTVGSDPEGWILSQNALGRRQETPWTSCQSITNLTMTNKQSVTLYFTPTVQLIQECSPLHSQVFGLWGEADAAKHVNSAQKRFSRNQSLL